MSRQLSIFLPPFTHHKRGKIKLTVHESINIKAADIRCQYQFAMFYHDMKHHCCGMLFWYMAHHNIGPYKR